MQLSQKALEKFKKLYFEKFSEELSDEETKRKAEFLLNLYKVVYGGVEFIDNQIKENK